MTFVPDLVIAFTCTPIDRPWLASNRFDTYSTSAMASWPNRGCPNPYRSPAEIVCVTCWPSRFNCIVPVPAAMLSPRCCELYRAPGTTATRSCQFRPFTGSSLIWRGSRLALIDEDVVSINGASPVTVTDSWIVDGDIWRFNVTCWP